jgi:anti-sigma factor RsiW
MNQTHPTKEQLIDYVHRELESHEDAAIHAHLGECADCAQAHAAEVRLSEALRAQARATDRELPPGLKTTIFARAASEARPTWQSRLATSWRPLAALPIAAAIALLLYFGLPGRRSSRPIAAADAQYYMENHAALSATMPLGGNEAIPTVLTSDETTR